MPIRRAVLRQRRGSASRLGERGSKVSNDCGAPFTLRVGAVAGVVATVILLLGRSKLLNINVADRAVGIRFR